MKIINGKKFYKKDMDAAVQIGGGGWNHSNGRNVQWYYLGYDPNSGYTVLDADNSGDCYGDYGTYEFASLEEFFLWAKACDRDVGKLLGDIDEDDTVKMEVAEQYVQFCNKNKSNS